MASPSLSWSVSPTSRPTERTSSFVRASQESSLRAALQSTRQSFRGQGYQGGTLDFSDLYATFSPSGAKEKHDNGLGEAGLEGLDEGQVANAHAVHVLTETVPGETATRARKNLCRDMENRLAEGIRQFLKAFSEVDQVGLFVIQVFPYPCLTPLVLQKLDDLQQLANAM